MRYAAVNSEKITELWKFHSPEQNWIIQWLFLCLIASWNVLLKKEFSSRIFRIPKIIKHKTSTRILAPIDRTFRNILNLSETTDYNMSFWKSNFSVVLFSPLWRIYKTSTHPEKQLESSDNARNSTFAGERLDRQKWESAVKAYTATFTKYTALWRRKTVS